MDVKTTTLLGAYKLRIPNTVVESIGAVCLEALRRLDYLTYSGITHRTQNEYLSFVFFLVPFRSVPLTN